MIIILQLFLHLIDLIDFLNQIRDLLGREFLLFEFHFNYNTSHFHVNEPFLLMKCLRCFLQDKKSIRECLNATEGVPDECKALAAQLYHCKRSVVSVTLLPVSVKNIHFS